LIAKPQVILVCQNSPVATIGNCSLIIGKAKTKKTFLLTSIASTVISGRSSISCLTRELIDIEVILVDTEQSPYHLHRTVDRIIRQVGEDKPKNFTAYGLRPLKAIQRVQVIETIVYKLERPALIIIDGLRDLLTRGINDESEATEILSKILKWTYEKECHIMLVLHQNKGDMNARGHVGTEAVNKSESVLSVAKDDKDGNISVVSAEYCRDIEFESFYFSIDEDGIPCDADPVETSQNRKNDQMSENFIGILQGTKSMSYTKLCNQYQEISGLAVATARRHVASAYKLKIIQKDSAGNYRLNETANNS
jgi:hypothetical protein